MLKKIIFFLFLTCTLSLSAQYISGVTIPDSSIKISTDLSDPSVKFANTITVEDMRKHLTIIAGDEFEGRETGTPGIDKAAEYISTHLKSLGITPPGKRRTYYQPVSFSFSKWLDSDIFIGTTRYKHLWDYLSFPDKNTHMPVIKADEVLFLGYGIDDPQYSDYKKNDVKGKVIMIYKGEPIKKDSTSWITGTRAMSEWTTDMDKKLILAKNKGVKLVLIIEPDIKKLLAQNRRKLLGAAMQLGDLSKRELPYANSAYISTTLAKDIIGKKEKKVIKSRKRSNKKGKACDVNLKSPFVINQSKKIDVLKGNNILGVILGTDKKDEVVIVSAHYDHLGIRGDDVYNGADDNGSGTTTVLEIAEAFKKASLKGFKPRRTIVFLWVTGEEKGLLGSDYYSQNPIYPLENTVANVNIDMVGRIDEKYTDNPNYIYVIGSDRLSTDLHNITEEVNKKYAGLTLDYTYNSETDPNRYYYRSDHYNFAKNGIPSVFFFNGVHADYHKITDTVEKINFEKMAKVGKLIFHTIWELANREERIVVDGEVK